MNVLFEFLFIFFIFPSTSLGYQSFHSPDRSLRIEKSPRNLIERERNSNNLGDVDKYGGVKPSRENIKKISKHKPSKFHHFWRSTGLCPPQPYAKASEFLLSSDETVNLALIGSLPFQAISQVRVHWLLNLVNARISESSVPEFEFRNIDKFMDTLYSWRLKPGFEIMGNPSDIFNDFENSKQLNWWQNLIQELAERYIERYGLNWVKTWNWESWNEPDHHDFDNLNFTTQGFLNYFVATLKGIRGASVHLRYGGPGGSCRDPIFSKLCWKILKLANNSPEVKLDYISFHSKGNEDVDSMIDEEFFKISKIRETFQNLKDVPVLNDEADFLKGWWKSREWRADNRYAALVVRSVTRHAYLRHNNPRMKYQLMSFDNAFLNDVPVNYFDQRTLVARFRIKSYSEKNSSMFVKKPSYFVMGMLSLLGNYMISPDLAPDDPRITILGTLRKSKENNIVRHQKHFGKEIYLKGNISKLQINPDSMDMENPNMASTNVGNMREIYQILINYSNEQIKKFIRLKKINIPTVEISDCSNLNNLNDNMKRRHKFDFSLSTKIDEISIILSNSNKTQKSSEKLINLICIIVPTSLINATLYMVEYSLDGNQKGPYEAWLKLGRPKEPSFEQIQYIAQFEGVAATNPKKIVMSTNELLLKIESTVPAVKLIHICYLNVTHRPKVLNVRCLTLNELQVLITWSDKLIETRCVRHYQVYYAKNWPQDPLLSIKKKIKLANNVVYSVTSTNETTSGWYAVRAVLYNGLKGQISQPTFHSTHTKL